MFDILKYLFENFIHSEIQITASPEELVDELSRAGFADEDIEKALVWLNKLIELQDTEITPYVESRELSAAIRVYTKEEVERLDVRCRGFITYLEQHGILNFTTREMVIDRVMELDIPHFTVENLKWVVLMVLFNAPGNEGEYTFMEDLLFDEYDGWVH